MSLGPTTQHAIVELAQERASALVRRDGDALSKLLSPEFVYTNADGAVFKKHDYLQAYVFDPSVSWLGQDLTDVHVHASGDVAVLVAKVHDVAKFGDQDLDADFRTTQVYVRRHGEWQYLAGHTSNLARE